MISLLLHGVHVTCRRWHKLVDDRLQRGPLALHWGSVKSVKQFSGHTRAVISGAFAPDGGTFVTVSIDCTARVWATTDWSHLHTLTGHTGGVNSCAFAPDGGHLITVSGDRTARVWVAGDWSHLCTLTGHTDSVDACAFAPNGGILVTVSYHTTRIWADE